MTSRPIIHRDLQGKRFIPDRKTKARLSEPQSSSNPERSLLELRRWRTNREAARESESRATGYMRRAALDAKAAGATGEQIAKAAGMSRQAVYDLMKEKER